MIQLETVPFVAVGRGGGGVEGNSKSTDLYVEIMDKLIN